MSILARFGRWFRGDASTALLPAPAPVAQRPQFRGDAVSLTFGAPAGAMAGGFSNPVTGHGMAGMDSRLESRFRAGLMTDELAIEMWRGDEIAHRIISMLPAEAMEPGFELSIQDEERTVGGQVDTRRASDLVEDVTRAHRNLRTAELIQRANEWERLFGGSAIWAGANDMLARSWDEPLNLDAPNMRIQWLDVIRSRDLFPERYYLDPAHPKYGQVEVWRLSRVTGAGAIMQQALIHESRLFLFRGRRIVEDGTVLTQNLQSTEFGDGILLAIQGELRRFSEALDNTELAMRANGELVWTHENLSEILANDGGGDFEKLVRAMQFASSILRARVVGAGQSLTRQGVSLAGLSDLVDKYENRVASLAGVPRTKLFGEAPGGLGNNGAGPQGDWDETKRVFRKNKQLPAYEWITKLIFRSLGGEPRKWKIEGNPYRQPTEAEKTAQTKEEMGIDTQALSAQIVTVDEVRARPIWRERYSLPDPNVEPANDLGEMPDDIRTPGGAPQAAPGAPPSGEQAAAEAAPAADAPKAADLALNGAQALALAAIVEKVAVGAIPRSSGAELVQFTFKVPAEQAERMMPAAGFVPSTVPKDVQPAAQAAEQTTDAADRNIDSLIKRLAPSGKCAECGKEKPLEVDHVHGRGWDPAEMSAKQRADRYWEEYDNGKKLRALCRECNARDGAKNKQGKSGPAHRGDAITTGANRRFTFAPIPADVAEAMRALQEEILPPGGEAQEIDHITLVHCPSAEGDIDEGAVSAAVAALEVAAEEHEPIRAKVQGWAYFDGARKDGEDRTALVALIDAPGITELQVALRAALADAGMEPSSAHSFSPHFTFCYLPPGGRVEGLPPLPPTEFVIDTVCFANREVHQVALGGSADEPLDQATEQAIERIELVTPYQMRALAGEDREALVATLELLHDIPCEMADRLIPQGPGDFGGGDDGGGDDDGGDDDGGDEEEDEDGEDDLVTDSDEDQRTDDDREDCDNPIRGEGGLFDGCAPGEGSSTGSETTRGAAPKPAAAKAPAEKKAPAKKLTPKQKAAAKAKAVREKARAKVAKAKAKIKAQKEKARAKVKAAKEKEKAKKLALKEKAKAKREKEKAKKAAKAEKAAAKRAAAQLKKKNESTKAKEKKPAPIAKPSSKPAAAEMKPDEPRATPAPAPKSPEPAKPQPAASDESPDEALPGASYRMAPGVTPTTPDDKKNGYTPPSLPPAARVSAAKQKQLMQEHAATRTPEQVKAEKHYASMAAFGINSALRKGTLSPRFDKDRIQKIETLSASIDSSAPLPEDTMLFRGSSLSGAEFFKELKPGDVYEDKGFTSTSASERYVKQSNSEVHIRIRAPKGTKAAPIATELDHEQELLLQKGSRFRVEGYRVGTQRYEDEVKGAKRSEERALIEIDVTLLGEGE